MIKVKRAYEPADSEDGTRFLVDRLWPRGIEKDRLKVDAWLKDVAPSMELRKWFSHDPTRWREFQRRYFSELKANPNGWQSIVEATRKATVTLVYGAKDETHNNAVALQEFLKAHVARRR